MKLTGKSVNADVETGVRRFRWCERRLGEVFEETGVDVERASKGSMKRRVCCIEGILVGV
jgi:hypothetical protein